MIDNQSLTGKHVFVVEDEMIVLMAIEDMMDDLGAESVTVAANVEQALSLICGQHFDFATVDVNLDGERSDRVADALAVDSVPFAFSTGYGTSAISAAHGDRPVLKKPYNTANLAKIVDQLFPYRRASDAVALSGT